MRAVLLVPLLLCACAGSWPGGSYAKMGSEADVGVLAPAVSDCLEEIVPYHVAISLTSSDPVLTSFLTDDLAHSGLTLRADGQPVRYVVAPFDTGMFIRVASPHGICSRYFARTADGAVKPSGPLMVVTQ